MLYLLLDHAGVAWPGHVMNSCQGQEGHLAESSASFDSYMTFADNVHNYWYQWFSLHARWSNVVDVDRDDSTCVAVFPLLVWPPIHREPHRLHYCASFQDLQTCQEKDHAPSLNLAIMIENSISVNLSVPTEPHTTLSPCTSTVSSTLAHKGDDQVGRAFRSLQKGCRISRCAGIV